MDCRRRIRSGVLVLAVCALQATRLFSGEQGPALPGGSTAFRYEIATNGPDFSRDNLKLDTAQLGPAQLGAVQRADGEPRSGETAAVAPQLPAELRQAGQRYGYAAAGPDANPSAPRREVARPVVILPRPAPRTSALAASVSSRRTEAAPGLVRPVVSRSVDNAASALRLVRQEEIPPGRAAQNAGAPAAPMQQLPAGRFPQDLPISPDGSITLTQATSLALEFNPILRSARAQIESARGMALQAGLWNNPRWDTNNPQVLGAGQSNQYNAGFQLEIPIKGKKRLDRAAAEQQVRQAMFDYRTERMNMLSQVRRQFYELLAQQRRVEITRELVGIVRRAKDVAEALRRAGVQAEIDVLAFSIELQRLEAALVQAERILAGRRRMLSATMGLPNLPIVRAAGRLDAGFPDFDEGALRQYVATRHPRVLTAIAEVDRRRILLQRADVEPYPNPYTGPAAAWGQTTQPTQFWYNIQFNIPVWNLNQGARRAAAADIRDAQASLYALRNDLLREAADAYSRYRAIRALAERYGRDILPLAIRNQELNREGYEKREFELARFLQAQRILSETYLDYIGALEQLWESAAEIANLMQLEQFP